MDTIIHAYVILRFIICFPVPGFAVIAAFELWLRYTLPHMRRTQRGKYWRWSHRKLGLMGDGPYRGAWLFLVATPMIFFVPRPFNSAGLLVYWLFMGVVLAIDWITGSEDPPYRRWVASLAKKLKISAPPRPAIDLS